MKTILRYLVVGSALLAALWLPPADSEAQELETISPNRRVQLGLGIAPGVGTQVGYVVPTGIITGEGMSYFNLSPGYGGGEGSMQISGALGGAFRIFRLLRESGAPQFQQHDMDFGVRFGPHFFIPINAEHEVVDPTRTFSIFVEPFLRGITTLESGRMLYIEFGLQAPLLRFGLMLQL